MEFFDSKSIEKAATITEWIETMETALMASVEGNYIMPVRMHLDSGRNTFLLMPCITDEYWSTKLVSFCPGNGESGRPSIYGTLILNDSKSGEPLAVMDGSIITAMRTAAVSATGIKALSPPGCRSLGIIGTGRQGIFQALFACAVRDIEVIRAYDKNISNLNRFSDEVHTRYPEVRIVVGEDSSEVAINSEIIITATNSPYPVFPDDKHLFSGKTIVGIGSYKPDCREFPEQLFRLVDQIFTDTPDGKKESGDLITPVRNNWVKEDKIYTLGELYAGNVALTENPTRLFKTVGSALFDLFAAKLIYEKLIKRQR
jgi:ornithine cyclodeaminase/alanine dehydrogenase-like protein (mu-crystallin family)